MTRNTRRILLFGCAGAAAVLAMSSAAFACTIFKGKMTITDSQGRTSVSVGNNTGMGYCTTPTHNASGAAGSSVSISVVAATTADCSTTSSLTANTGYDINFVGGRAMAGSGGSYTWFIDCMSPPGAGVSNITNVTTDASGNLSWSGSVPSGARANKAGQDSAFCVSTTNGGSGNQGGFHVV